MLKMDIITIFPCLDEYKEKLIRFINNIIKIKKENNLIIYYYNKKDYDLSFIDNISKNIKLIEIESYSFNSIIKILKDCVDVIFTELDIDILELDFNKLDSYSFGVFDINDYNYNTKRLKLPNHYKTITNEIFYFRKKYKNYFINFMENNVKNYKYILDENKSLIVGTEPKTKDKNFRYETSLLELSVSFNNPDKYFEVKKLKNSRFIIDKGLKAKLL